jgi:hypothetical protein
VALKRPIVSGYSESPHFPRRLPGLASKHPNRTGFGALRRSTEPTPSEAPPGATGCGLEHPGNVPGLFRRERPTALARDRHPPARSPTPDDGGGSPRPATTAWRRAAGPGIGAGKLSPVRPSIPLLLLQLACAAAPPGGSADAPSAAPSPATPPPTNLQVRTLLPPAPANTFQNSTFTSDGKVLYLASDDADRLWSFDLATATLLDGDGLELPGPGLASNPTLLTDGLLAVPGWFPDQGIAVVDVRDPRALRLHGVVSVPATASVQGMEVWSADGKVGWVASFPDDRLYAFDAQALRLLDPAGLPLPGNPDRAALARTPAGPRLVLVDTEGGRLMVVDIGAPTAPRVAGVIAFPEAATFGSSNYPVIAADGTTGFVVSQQRRLYSFDVATVSLLVPEGLLVGSDGAGLSPSVVDLPGGQRRVAAVTQKGVALVDATAPRSLRSTGFANLDGAALVQGDARAVFSPDGRWATFAVLLPQMALAAVDAVSGQSLGIVPVGGQPNFTARVGDDRVAVLCSATPDGVWLVDGLFATLHAASAKSPPG